MVPLLLQLNIPILKRKVQSNIGGASVWEEQAVLSSWKPVGQGKVCISGSGTLLELEITPEQGEVTIDNGHVTAWDASLNYNIGIPKLRWWWICWQYCQ